LILVVVNFYTISSELQVLLSFWLLSKKYENQKEETLSEALLILYGDNFLKYIFDLLELRTIHLGSGSQTFLVRGPLRKIWLSAKDKILNYIGIRGPPVVRGVDFGNHCTRVSLSVRTNIEAASLSVQGGPRYPYGFICTSRFFIRTRGFSYPYLWIGLVIRTFKDVRINFSVDSESSGGGGLVISTVPITRP